MARSARKGTGEQALDANEEISGIRLLASIVESAEDAIISTTLDGVVTSCNRSAEKMYGYDAGEIVGKPVSVLLPPEVSGEMDEALRRARDGQYVHQHETYQMRKDGSYVHVSLTVSPIQDSRGRPIGASCIARDITERKRLEEQQQSTSQYARSLIEASLDPLVTISAEGKITDVNEATAKVTGTPRERLIGTDFSNYFTEPDKARAGYEQVFARGFVTEYPLTIRHRDGRLTDVLYNASVYRDAQGNVIGVFAAARDVTGRKRMEAELAEQRRRELDRLAELEKFQRLTVGRELKMVELKKEIAELRGENEELKKKLGLE